jgi:hypothetical protein
MHDLRPGTRGQTDFDAVGRGIRYADDGACVPWATMAAIERATRDAQERRAIAALGRRQGIAGALGRIRRRLVRLLRRDG